MTDRELPLSKLRILVQDGTGYRSFAKVDLLDAGNGLLLYDYGTGLKLSAHSDGREYRRVPGVGAATTPTTSIRFSDIAHRTVYEAPIPPCGLESLPPYQGPTENAFVFSSTVFPSNGTFAAEIADDRRLTAVLEGWKQHPDYVSAQTWRPTGTGKNVVLTVLNRRSTGAL